EFVEARHGEAQVRGSEETPFSNTGPMPTGELPTRPTPLPPRELIIGWDTPARLPRSCRPGTAGTAERRNRCASPSGIPVRHHTAVKGHVVRAHKPRPLPSVGGVSYCRFLEMAGTAEARMKRMKR